MKKEICTPILALLLILFLATTCLASTNQSTKIIKVYNKNNASSSTKTNSQFDLTSIPNAPAPPTNPLVIGNYSQGFNFSWIDNNNDYNGFEISSGTTSAANDYLQYIYSTTQKNYIDSSSIYCPGTTKYYKVAAFAYGSISDSSTYNFSAFTNVVSGTIPNGIPPIPNLTLIRVRSTSSMELMWNADYCEGINIERSTNPNSGFTLIAQGSNGDYLDSGLSPGTYYYRINGSNSYVTSAYSNVMNMTIGPPAAPQMTNAKITSTTGISFGWTDANCWGFCYALDNFTVERANSYSGPFAQIVTLSSSSSYYQDSGLTNGNTYYYRIRADNSLGYSYSAIINITLGLPSSPSNPIVIPKDGAIMEISWINTANNLDGTAIDYSNFSNGPWVPLVRPSEAGLPSSTKYLQRGVSNGTTYFYRLYAFNLYGNSTYAYINGTMPAQWIMQIQKLGTGTGTVTTDPPGINCGSICSAPMPFNSDISIYFLPDVDSIYEGIEVSACPAGQCLRMQINVTFNLASPIVYHPADINKDKIIDEIEASNYNTAFKQGLNWLNTGLLPAQTNATRANYLFLNGENYNYNSSLPCPACWYPSIAI